MFDPTTPAPQSPLPNYITPPTGENHPYHGKRPYPPVSNDLDTDTSVAPPYTAILAAIADDDMFCEDLLEWVRANAHCRVNSLVLEYAGVIARLCALPD